MTALLLLGLLAAGAAQSTTPPTAATAQPCVSPLARDEPARLHRAGAFLSAHHLALVLRTLCPDAPAAGGWALVSALALVELDDSAQALQSLSEGLSADRDPRLGAALAWIHLRQGDQQAFARALARLPAPTRLRLEALSAAEETGPFAERARRLPDPLGPAALAAGADLQRALTSRRPWLAGSLSAVLPGAGQVYAGSWQSAAVAFVLNAVMIGATVELARHRLYATAAASGTLASVFYVGSIVNAADLARRRNQAAALPHRQRLQHLLVPEVNP